MARVDVMQRALDSALRTIARRLSPPPAPRSPLVEQDSGPHAAPRVLLLTSTLGSGHLRAAQAVEAALLEQCPAAKVETLDFWSLMDAGVAQALRQTYLCLVQQHPELYDRIFQLDERTWRQMLQRNQAAPPSLAEGLALLAATSGGKAQPGPDGGRHAADRVLLRLFCAALPKRARTSSGNGVLMHALVNWGQMRLAQRLDARLRAFAPGVVVATSMHPAALLSSIKTRRQFSLPTLGVLTDFGMHDFWIQPGIDSYCIAHESIPGLQDIGSEPARLLATGIPLMPGFCHPPSTREARLRLCLDPDAPVVTVLGGGLGLGVDAIAERLLVRPGPLYVLVLVGRNDAARKSLAPLAGRYPGRLGVWDWTEQMEVFIRAADIVVGKPGGITVAEALACGRPLLATHSLRGQEGFNVRFLEQHGVGQLVPEDELVERIESLLANRDELERIQQRAWTLGKRDAAARIAESVLAFAQARSHDEVER
jgi:UDP-N-acetylglucosamine:LPS N-acetylglucosamine transferase